MGKIYQLNCFRKCDKMSLKNGRKCDKMSLKKFRKCGGVVMDEQLDIEFKRKAYDKILEWKEKRAPDYALFLKGARRVGKSTLAEKIGKEKYKSYILIRFDKAPDEIKNLFVNSLEDLDNLFNTLQVFYKKKLYERESLIILDEIQLFPLARQALKTLLEDKRYDYIETGSLATIKKKSKKILIPSEEYALNIYPMDFEEFLWAKGDSFSYELIKDHYNKLKPIGTAHRSLMRAYREYMLVGGMPQAVYKYIKTSDYGEVDFVKQGILNLYESDIDEQEEKNPEYVKNVFLHIPSELSKHDKRYNLSHVDTNARLREYKGPINWLIESMTVNVAENVSDPSAAFNLSTIDPAFKCYMGDTGLLISLAYKNQDYLNNELYKAILLDRLHVNEGMIIENITAQELRKNGDNIYYYKKTDKEKKQTIMEIDFLIRRDNKLIPIEVKSSKAYSLSSLKQFKKCFSSKVGLQYVLYDGDIKREEEIIYLPYYMASVL